jgi:hypothetical protein
VRKYSVFNFPTSSMSRSSTASTEDSLEEFILSVYFSVWRRFHDYDAVFCREILDSLVAPAPSASIPGTSGYLPNHEQEILEDLEEFHIRPAEKCTEFTVVEFDVEGHTVSERRLAAGTVSFESTTRPCDAYEASAPCSRTIEIGDDSDYLPFIPFADETHFDWEDYMEFFGHLSWQSEQFRDPDRTQFFIF